MEFQFGDREVGHAHRNGTVDIPFPRTIRDALLADGLAGEHHWVPNSGWITFRMRGEEDLRHALWLLRLSYLRYPLKTTTDPQKRFEQESEELRGVLASNRYFNHSSRRVPNRFWLSRSRHNSILKEVTMEGPTPIKDNQRPESQVRSQAGGYRAGASSRIRLAAPLNSSPPTFSRRMVESPFGDFDKRSSPEARGLNDPRWDY
jgi:Family of unknown function (DUF5519)